MTLNKLQRSLKFVAALLLPTALLVACEEHARACSADVKPAVIVNVDALDEQAELTYAFEEEGLRPCEAHRQLEGNRLRYWCGTDRTGSLLVQATLPDGEVRERTFTITGNHCGPRQAIEIGLADLPVVQEGSGE